jgi:peptidoglycan biosynthesis protein MviN/MurJ (putative lipid II flippase)
LFNLLLATALVWRFKQAGLGIANTVTSLVNVWLLTYALRLKLKKLEMESLRNALLPLAVAGVLAGLVGWFGWRFWERSLGHATLTVKIGAVFAPAIGAGLIYWLTAMALQVPAAKEMSDLFFQRFRRKPRS